MIKNQYNIIHYKTTVGILINNVIHGLITTHPLLGKVGHKTASHAGPIRNIRGSKPLDQDLEVTSGKGEISIYATKDANIEDYIVLLWKLYISMAEDIEKGIFKNLLEITTATGNVVDAKGKILSYDHFLDTVEMIEISFDENGNPQYPTLIASPDLYEKIKKIVPTEEQKIREQEIIEKKRVEFYAKKRTRKLYK